MVKNPLASAGDVASVPVSGRSLEKEMATHSSVLAWETPRTEEPGGPQSMVSSIELAGKNVKVLIVLERSMRKHKAFCSCAQKIIYNH